MQLQSQRIHAKTLSHFCFFLSHRSFNAVCGGVSCANELAVMRSSHPSLRARQGCGNQLLSAVAVLTKLILMCLELICLDDIIFWLVGSYDERPEYCYSVAASIRKYRIWRMIWQSPVSVADTSYQRSPAKMKNLLWWRWRMLLCRRKWKLELKK